MIDQTLIEKSRSAAKFTLIFRSCNHLLGGIAAILLVRALSENDYGVYHLLYAVCGLIGTLASFGATNTLQRFVPEYYQKGEFIIAHRLYMTGAYVRLASNIMIIGIILLFWELLAPLFKLEGYKTYFMLFSLVICMVRHRPLIETCLSSFFLQKYARSIGCLFPLIKVLGYGWILLFDKSLWYAILTDLTALTIIFIGYQVLYHKKIPISQGKTKRFPAPEKKRLLRYAGFYSLNEAGDGLLNSFFDTFIIAILMTQADVGAYAFCVTTVVLIGQIFPLNYFREIIRAALFSANANVPDINVRLFFQNSLKLNAIFSIPCFFFLLTTGPSAIICLLGGKYLETVPVLCTIFFFFEVASLRVALIAQLREKADIILYSKIFAIYNIIADLVLIKFFGIWGAALATGTAVLFKDFFIWYFVRGDADFKGMGPFYFKIVLFWTTAALAITGVVSIVSHPWLQLAAGTMLFSLAFIVQFQCYYFTENDKKVWSALTQGNRLLTQILSQFKMIDKPVKSTF